MRRTRMVGALSLASLSLSLLAVADSLAQEPAPTDGNSRTTRVAVDPSTSTPPRGTSVAPLVEQPPRRLGEPFKLESIDLMELFGPAGHLPVAAPPDPAVARAHLDLANAAFEAKDYDRAIAEYTETIRNLPGVATVFHLRAKARQWKRDLDGAIADENQAIWLAPSYSEAYSWRANAYYLKGEFSKAIDDLTRVIQFESTSPEGYYERARARLMTGDSDGAIADCSEVVRLKPQDADALLYRGAVLAALGKFDRAVVDYDAAIRIDFERPKAHTDLAWILAACSDAKVRDGQRALAEATGACELTGWNDFRAISALAAAHARIGDFDEAKRRQESAMSFNSSAEDRVKGRVCLILYTLKLTYNYGAAFESRPEPGQPRYSIGLGVSDRCGRYLELRLKTDKDRWHLIWAKGRPYFFEHVKY